MIVVGGGQGGLESAALARRAGADVEVIVRSPLRWFTDREPYRPRGALQQRIYRVAYPVVGYGPPPLNRLALHPDWFYALPEAVRRRVAARILRAGGSPWVRQEIEGRVAVTEGVAVRGLPCAGEQLHLELDDGSVRDADAVVISTGFRFSLERMAFLSPSVRAGVTVQDGGPSSTAGSARRIRRCCSSASPPSAPSGRSPASSRAAASPRTACAGHSVP